MKGNNRKAADSARFAFTGALWLYRGEKAAWHFVTLPQGLAVKIKALYRKTPAPPGFGTVKVSVRIGKTEWSTSLFPDKKSGSYLLPIKAAVRKREGLSAGDFVSVVVSVMG